MKKRRLRRQSPRRRQRKETTEGLDFHQQVSVLLLQFHFLLVWWVSAEILDFHAHFWLPIVWSLGALLAGLVSLTIENRPLRVLSYFIFLVTAAGYCFLNRKLI